MTTNDVFDMLEARARRLFPDAPCHWFNDDEELAVDEGIVKHGKLTVLIGHVGERSGLQTPPGQVAVKSMRVAVSVIKPLTGGVTDKDNMRALNDALDTVLSGMAVDTSISGPQWFATDPYRAHLLEVEDVLPVTGVLRDWTGYRILINIGFTR